MYGINFRHHIKSGNSHFTGLTHNTHLFLIMCSMQNQRKMAISTPFTYVDNVCLFDYQWRNQMHCYNNSFGNSLGAFLLIIL